MKRWLLPRLYPFRVRVISWNFTATHFAWSAADALSWAACYPRDDTVEIFNRRGRLVARRPATGA